MDNFEVWNGKATYPGYLTSELEAAIAAGQDITGKMALEVSRRAKVAAGDTSVMTGAERLRHARENRKGERLV